MRFALCLFLPLLMTAACASPSGPTEAPAPEVPAPTEALATAPEPPASTPESPPTSPRDAALPGGGDLDCAAPDNEGVALVACQVIDALRQRDAAALQSLMDEPFVTALWRSEGRAEPPAVAAADLVANALPADPAASLTFTANRDAFPALDGLPVAALMGPDVGTALVLFGTGWGPDGAGEALLYFSTHPVAGFIWHGLILAPEGFE